MKLYGLLQQGLAWCGEKLNWTRFQWEPTLTAHDPNPPVTLENASGTPATALAAPGTATGTFPSGKATGAAQVGAAPGTATGTTAAGKATGAATVGASPGVASSSVAPGRAIGSQPAVTGGGGVFGPGQVGVSYPQVPRPAKPVSRAAVARAAPGRGFSDVPPGRAIGVVSIPGTARAAPGEGRSETAPGRATGVGRGYVVASYGSATGTAAPGRALGGATVTLRGADLVGVAAPGGARAGATAGAAAAEARSSVGPGGAVGLHNPTDEELAALAFLLDDLRAAA